MSVLMIVESPKKAKEIGKYLGADYVVLASYGHIRDLPEKGREDDEIVTGVNKQLQARYEISEGSRAAVAKLREAAKKASRVVLATDPDREGEAIAWHLQQALRLRDPERVTYQEISKAAVEEALRRPRRIDLDLVQAQEARRVADRLVGYAASPVLSEKAGTKLSAGRVQSAALRLVVEREREIRSFTVRHHYGAELSFAGGWKAQWRVKPHLPEGQEHWLDRDVADRVAAIRSVSVLEFADGTAKEPPAAPFTTSTLQQEAAKRFGMKVKAVMDAAQSLFQSGAISYHRTDSPNFAERSQALIREYAAGAGLPVSAQPRRWRAKAAAQEGHEAIRPVDMSVESAGETEDERKLYALIRVRALASQLEDAEYATRRVILAAIGAERIGASGVSPATPTFEATGRVLVSPGWRIVDGGDTKEDEETQDGDAGMSNPIPVLAEGQQLEAEAGRRVDKKTAPPRRYTEAGLVKELEARGIGRPSTYAAIIANISTRSYVLPDPEKGKYLVPSTTGEALIDALVGSCSFVNYEYTAALEDELDQVARGNRRYDDVVHRMWQQLKPELDAINLGQLQASAHACPECGKGMRRLKAKSGDGGFFWGCSGYPECKATLPDVRGKPGAPKPKPETSSEHRCVQPGCGKPLVHRVKKPDRAGKGGYDFWGCSGYPDCKATYKTGADGKPQLNPA